MRVEPGSGGEPLHLGKSFKLSGHNQDLRGQCRRFEVFELRIHADDRPLADAPTSGRTVTRGNGGMMFLDHLGPYRAFESSFCWGSR